MTNTNKPEVPPSDHDDALQPKPPVMPSKPKPVPPSDHDD
jgi:hypothetical protein